MLKCDLLLLVALFFCIFAFMEIYVDGYYDDWGRWHKGYCRDLGYVVDYDHVNNTYPDSRELAWDYISCEIISECMRNGINIPDTDIFLDLYFEEFEDKFKSFVNQKNRNKHESELHV